MRRPLLSSRREGHARPAQHVRHARPVVCCAKRCAATSDVATLPASCGCSGMALAQRSDLNLARATLSERLTYFDEVNVHSVTSSIR
eukprot:6179854-Pleurochrysis_carterae.AAC.5